MLTTANVTLAAINETVTAAAVTAATLLAKAGYADADGKAVPSGIAITADANLLGTWQWLNGSTWTSLPSVSANTAFLLPGAGQVRFKPADNLSSVSGFATLQYLAWDETAGAANYDIFLGRPGGHVCV